MLFRQRARRIDEHGFMRAEQSAVCRHHAHNVGIVKEVVYMLRNDDAGIRVEFVYHVVVRYDGSKLILIHRLVVHVEYSLFRPIFVRRDLFVQFL